jgi:hypothetical protein
MEQIDVDDVIVLMRTMSDKGIRANDVATRLRRALVYMVNFRMGGGEMPEEYKTMTFDDVLAILKETVDLE